MPKYNVHAIDLSGKESTSQIEAPSEADALVEAQKKKLTVIELEEVSSARPAFGFSLAKKVNSSTVLSFYEQLSFLIKAGIPVFQAIKMLSDTFRDRVLQKCLQEVAFELSEGFPLSLALQKYPESFPPLHTSLIAVGEKSGNLDAALMQLVDLVKEHRDIKERLVKAAAYPVFLLAMSVGLVIGLLLYIFPKFEEIFAAFKVKLPATTTFFLTLSQGLRAHLTGYALFAGATIGAIIYFFTSEKMSFTRDKTLFKTPLIDQVLIFQFVAIFAKTLCGLLGSGIPLLEALYICKDTLHGQYKAIFFDRLISTVKEGDPVSRGMEEEILIPEMAKQLVQVGEKTGRIDSMMDNIFHFYKKQYIERLGVATAVLQPLLLFVAAGLIAMVAISLFVPLFKLGASMKSSV